MRGYKAALAAADKQLGVITRKQALCSGMTVGQIRSAISRGLLVAIHPATYRTAGSDETLAQRAIAACLAAGSPAFVSHVTAATVWGLLGATEGPVHITISRSQRPRLTGVIAHRSRLIGPGHQTNRGALPIASSARTIVDLATVLDETDLEQALDQALRAKLVSPQRLLSYMGAPAFARFAGISRLRRLVEDRQHAGIPESRLEVLALGVLRRHGLPDPMRQYETRVNGRPVRFDLAYPKCRLAIELDGRAPHWGRERWQADHDRRNATELGGWRCLHFTWWDVTERPLWVVLLVGEALSLRPSRWLPGGRRQASHVPPEQTQTRAVGTKRVDMNTRRHR